MVQEAEGSKGAAATVLTTLEALSRSADPTSPDSDHPEGLTVAELARALGRDKSTVSRQLRPMVELGLVERTEDGRHRLGWRLFTLAARAGDQRLLLLATPVMRRLADLTHERVHLSVLRGVDVLTILSESSGQTIEAVGWVGRTTPVLNTSTGRALLLDHTDDELRRFLDPLTFSGQHPEAAQDLDDLLERINRARDRGFALASGEFEPGLVGAAAPVRGIHGQIVAALNVSAPSYRLGSRLPWLGKQVAAAATHLTHAVSASRPTEPPAKTRNNT